MSPYDNIANSGGVYDYTYGMSAAPAGSYTMLTTSNAATLDTYNDYAFGIKKNSNIGGMDHINKLRLTMSGFVRNDLELPYSGTAMGYQHILIGQAG